MTRRASFYELCVLLRYRNWQVWKAGLHYVAVRPPKSVEHPSRTRKMTQRAFRQFADQVLKAA